MWSKHLDDEAVIPPAGQPARDRLLLARAKMAQALTLLDSHSVSAAAASLDMALHQLDRELSGS